MSAHRLCTIGLCALLAASASVAQTGLPSGVQAADDRMSRRDPDDRDAEAPAAPAIVGLRPSGSAHVRRLTASNGGSGLLCRSTPLGARRRTQAVAVAAVEITVTMDTGSRARSVSCSVSPGRLRPWPLTPGAIMSLRPRASGSVGTRPSSCWRC